MDAFKPIQITHNFYQLETPFPPVYPSVGDDTMIIEGKAAWVPSIADHMPYKVMEPMCRLLINHSEAEAEHPDLSFEL